MKRLFKLLVTRYSILQLIYKIMCVLDILALFGYCIFELYKFKIRLNLITILIFSLLCFILENLIYNRNKFHLRSILRKYYINNGHPYPKRLKQVKLNNSHFFNLLVITNMEIFGIILSVLYASYSIFHLQLNKVLNKSILLGIMIISLIYLIREICYYYKISISKFSKAISYYYRRQKIEEHNMKVLSEYEETTMCKFVNKIGKDIIHLL